MNKYLTFDDVNMLCEVLVNQKIEDINKYDRIVTVAYGGLIPASIIAYKMKIKNITVVTPDDEIPSYCNEKTLIVDDVCDTGKTFRNLKNLHYDTAALIHKPWSEFTPTYYAIISESWIVFPWEIN